MSTRDGSATGIADGATARSFKARASRPSAPGSAPEAFTLHHKFYMHVDAANNFWLSAEDGCEGVATPPAPPRERRERGAGARDPFAIFGK